MFIDKPITVKESNAVEFMQECKTAGVKLVGGSSCKFVDLVMKLKREALQEKDDNTIGGFVRCPIDLENDYGNFYFYSQHLVEIVCEIFGRYPESVFAVKNQDKITVLFNYKSFSVTGLYVDRNYCYFAQRMSDKKISGSEFSMSTQEPYLRELEEFYSLVAGKTQGACYVDFISPVFIMNAIQRSIENGEEIRINYAEI